MKSRLISITVIFLIIFSSHLISCGSSTSEGDRASTDLSYLVKSDPSEVDNSDLPVTPTDELFITGTPPEIDIDKYRLVVDGLVANPLSLTYEQLKRYPMITDKVLLICRGLSADNAVWTGIPLDILLEEAGVLPDAFLIVFYGVDGYSKNIPYAYLEEANVFLALKVNGQVLPVKHGYPLRAVVEGKYGSEWVKWIEHIEIK